MLALPQIIHDVLVNGVAPPDNLEVVDRTRQITLACSFCGESLEALGSLVASRVAAICQACAEMSREIAREKWGEQ